MSNAVVNPSWLRWINVSFCSLWCSFFFLSFLFLYVYIGLYVVVPMILQVVYFPVVGFLTIDLHWLVEFSIEFLGWNLWLGMYLADLK